MIHNPPTTQIYALHKNLFLKIFCTLYILLFFGIALPAHHHSDGIEHGDCAFCIVQKQTPTTETAFPIPTIACIIIEAFEAPQNSYTPLSISSFQSRAPPPSELS
jgi:hypothetical protein